ncbi:MAG TPA: hypothetical protein VMH23_06510 [Bacteroidota bacterium]|nr:hypothetical protein [Bacteroidota bacterium]
MKKFSVTAWVDTRRVEVVERAVCQFTTRKTIIPTDVGFFLRAVIRGSDAKYLNRELLTALRDLEPKTALHSEWRSGQRTQWFFNNVPRRSEKRVRSHHKRDLRRGQRHDRQGRQ